MLLQVLQVLSPLISELLATDCKAQNHPQKLFLQRHVRAAFVNPLIASHKNVAIVSLPR